jgi:hypothetical protein
MPYCRTRLGVTAPPLLRNVCLERLLLEPYGGYYSRGFIPEPMHQSSGKSAEYVWEDTALTQVASANVFSEDDVMIRLWTSSYRLELQEGR